MTTALSRYIDNLMMGLFPENQIPHFVDIDRFNLYMKHKLEQEIIIGYVNSGTMFTLNSDVLRPFESLKFMSHPNDMIYDHDIPDDVLYYLRHTVGERGNKDGEGCTIVATNSGVEYKSTYDN